MSFKFKLGEFVVPTMPKEMDWPVGPSKVIALQLKGYIQIQPVGTHRRLVVKADDYERCEEEVVEASDASNAHPPGWGTKTMLEH